MKSDDLRYSTLSPDHTFLNSIQRAVNNGQGAAFVDGPVLKIMTKSDIMVCLPSQDFQSVTLDLIYADACYYEFSRVPCFEIIFPLERSYHMSEPYSLHSCG